MSGGAEIVLAAPFALAAVIAEAAARRLEESLERACLAQQQQLERAEEERGRQAAFAGMVAFTRIGATADATETLLREGVSRLLTRTDLTADTRERCRALEETLRAANAPIAEQVNEYYALLRLAREADCPGAATGGVATAISRESAALEEMLASPLCDGLDVAARRAELQEHLAEMRALAARQPEVATQGLAQLRRRIERLLQERAERLEARRQSAVQVRDLLSTAMPQLQTVIELSPDEALRERAKALLTRLAEQLAREPLDSAALRAVAAEAEALLAAVRTALQELLLMQAFSEQVAEALLSLGYRVAQIPGEEALLAPLDTDIGVQLTVDGKGCLETEMVALSSAAEAVSPAAQEQVCAMVDELVAALRQRNCTVRERARKHFKTDHRLRVVSPPATEAVLAQTTAAPKQRSADGPQR